MYSNEARSPHLRTTFALLFMCNIKVRQP